jgi:hypothetical protein
MVQISLTSEDAETLEKALTIYLSDLRMEIADTDAHDFRTRLKEEQIALTRVLETLQVRPEPRLGQHV